MTLSTTNNSNLKTPGRVHQGTSQNEQSVCSNVKVVVRIRPENSVEHTGCFRIVVKAMNEHVLVFDPKEEHMHTPGYKKPVSRDLRKRARKDLKFAFDYVFGPHISNQTVYEHTTKTILDGFLNGYNCSVFAYGATGAGKTHTMLGGNNKPGVMYLTMIDLYDRINAIKEERSCEVAVSYLEIYNEQIKDLIVPNGTLPIREDANNGVIVSGLSLHKPKSAEELLHMLQHGNKNRSQHPTDANAESSRSHAVFQVYVRQKDRTANISTEVKVAKMCLVDLAGSERATVNTNRGVRFREGANINRSLLALGNVINALADNKSKGHIPYRDSKLTRLLKDSLGGNCRTVMIAATSPSSMSYDDTYNTLKYADRAKHIRATLKKNILSVDFHVSRYGQIVEDLRKEIIELKNKLSCYEEEKTVTGGTSKLVLNDEVVRLQDVLHSLFMTRLAIRKEVLDRESSKRDILWKLYKKEKIKIRIDIIDINNTQASDNLQRTATKNQNRLGVLGKGLEIANTKLNENNGWLDRVTTEMKLAGGDSKMIPEMLEVSLRMHSLEVELGDARHHSKHLKKLVKNQERETDSNDRLITNLLKLVRKQHFILKGHNILTTDLVDEFNQVKEEIDHPDISWADETCHQEVDGEKFNIVDILNLPVLNCLPLKGSTPSRVRNRRRSSLSPRQLDANNETKVAASVLKNSLLMDQRISHDNSNQSTEAGIIKETNPKLVPSRVLVNGQHPNNTSVQHKVNLSNIPTVKASLRRTVLSANTFNQLQSVSTDLKQNLSAEVSSLNKKVGTVLNTSTAQNTHTFKSNAIPSSSDSVLTPYKAKEERPVKCKQSYDISCHSDVVVTPYKAREEKPIKSVKTYDELYENEETLNSTYVKPNETFTKLHNKENSKPNQNETFIKSNTNINETMTLSSPMVLKENTKNFNSATVTKPSHNILNQTVTKAAPDVIKPPGRVETCKKPVARSILFESTPPSIKGMSYADVVKSPSPVRTPLQQISSNTGSCINRLSNVTPELNQINLDEYTPKYKLSAKCKDNLQKLRENMERTMSKSRYKRNKPSYMSMTKSSAIRSRLLFKDNDEPMTARRVPINSKSSLSGRMSKSKSTSSLSRSGWQF